MGKIEIALHNSGDEEHDVSSAPFRLSDGGFHLLDVEQLIDE